MRADDFSSLGDREPIDVVSEALADHDLHDLWARTRERSPCTNDYGFGWVGVARAAGYKSGASHDSEVFQERMNCRPECGACCIAPSISPCAALPEGKPAGVRCPHLDEHLRCRLFGRPERPATCVGLQPAEDMCGDSAEQAMATLIRWERLTAPDR